MRIVAHLCYGARVHRAERLSAILDRVGTDRSVEVATLAGDLGVSGATIRRDLQALSRSHLLVRTHGGAVTTTVGDELPVQVKAARRQPDKRRIGVAAAGLVPDGAVIGLTGGSTAVELARALGARRGITVVTNALNVAVELVAHPALRLVVIGGIARPSFELVGPATEAMLANYHLDTTFVGVDGLTVEQGCTTYDEMEAQTDRAFLERAQRRVVITDSSKIGRITFAAVSPLHKVTDLVTDTGVDPAQLEALRQAGVEVLTV